MSSSNVRDIEALADFASTLRKLGHGWGQSLQEVKATTQRAEEYFSHQQLAYWRRQKSLAEQEVGEAKDVLAQKQGAVRAADRSPATEATIRVRKAEQRLRLCEEKLRRVRSWALEVSRVCDELLGPLADVREHAEIQLPAATNELMRLVDHLRQYTDQTDAGSP